jgi:uncharacterized circularly permuted ATP-grasp superfamily protein/uncharacterized alpha-E superfamily protein
MNRSPSDRGAFASYADAYAAPPGAYDELKDATGALRPHWQAFLGELDKLDAAELSRRWDKARHLLHENGVSYNVYGDPDGLERPWNLSTLPLLLPADDFARIEEGISQRASLLDALLADLYGPQRTLLSGALPAALVFSNPGFLRACHGINVARGLRLPLYGVDLVRGPDGAFRVIEDRTQVPSGAGYALENRIVISSTLPEAFRACNVERLALFFRGLRDTLSSLAPHNRDNPRIVLLTPGPFNATYFEQAYLSQYLGFTLVNGGDLTVRGERVYLKTLGGLQPVDVILRRLNDDYCDPLELRPDSVLGIPGLVQAARAGNVAIASPLGSGLLQTPAFLPYLPRLCKQLLGEELRLSSVRSAWCGDPDGLAEGLSMLDDAVVKPAFAKGFVEPVFTLRLAAKEREALATKIRERPFEYVVQERVPSSTTPVLDGSAIAPRALVLRSFAVAAGSGYAVMPGGLARVAAAAEGSEVSMQLGARSKDVWVMSREEVSSFSLLPPAHRAVQISRGGSDLPSRAADNLYWLGRYAERAEGVARLARVISARLGELASESDLERSAEFIALLRALTVQTDLNYSQPLPADRVFDLETARQELVSAVFDAQRAGALAAVVRATLRAGRQVRDRISTDTWRVVASLDDELSAAAQDSHREELSTLGDMLSRVVVSLAAFSGLCVESMTRGQAFRFVDMGRRLERAMTLVSLLRATLSRGCKREGPLLEALLEVADSSMTYRRRYLATLEVAPVVDLLLTDETNPRAVIHQIESLTRHLAALPARDQTGVRGREQRLALGMLRDLELAEVESLCRPVAGQRPALEALLADLSARVPSLSDALSDSYLNHATVSRHLSQDEQPSEDSSGPFGGDP